MNNNVRRWYGVIRRKNGKFFYGVERVDDCKRQDEFIRKKLQPSRGDVVVELFINDKLEIWDFISYFREVYLGETPEIVLNKQKV